MKIKMVAEVSGTRNGEPWPARGKTLDVPDYEGADLCAAGLALPVSDEDGHVEKAVPAEPPETRMQELTSESASPVVPGDSAEAPAKRTRPAAKKTAAKKTTAE